MATYTIESVREMTDLVELKTDAMEHAVAQCNFDLRCAIKDRIDELADGAKKGGRGVWFELAAVKDGKARGIKLCRQVPGDNGRPKTESLFVWFGDALELFETTGPAYAKKIRESAKKGTKYPYKVWNGTEKKFVPGGHCTLDIEKPESTGKGKSQTVATADKSNDVPF
jgi:hypothetical protein